MNSPSNHSAYGFYGAPAQNNIYNQLHGKFGCGHEDFGTRPYAKPYPMAIIPKSANAAVEKSWLRRFLEKCLLI